MLTSALRDEIRNRIDTFVKTLDGELTPSVHVERTLGFVEEIFTHYKSVSAALWTMTEPSIDDALLDLGYDDVNFVSNERLHFLGAAIDRMNLKGRAELVHSLLIRSDQVDPESNTFSLWLASAILSQKVVFPPESDGAIFALLLHDGIRNFCERDGTHQEIGVLKSAGRMLVHNAEQVR